MDSAIANAIKVLESCEAKLQYLGRVFSSTNFTDRHGDGPDCLHRAAKARDAIATLRSAHIAPEVAAVKEACGIMRKVMDNTRACDLAWDGTNLLIDRFLERYGPDAAGRPEKK